MAAALALLITILGEAAAIRAGSVPLALATIVWWGFAFATLAMYRLDLALLGLASAVPLISVEVGLGNVTRTLSADKVALLVVASAWLVRRPLTAWRSLARVPAVRWWAAFLTVAFMSALSWGATLGEMWNVAGYATYAVIFAMTLDLLTLADPRRLLIAAGLGSGIVAVLALVEWMSMVGGRSPLPLYFKHGTMMDLLVAGSTITHRNFLGGYLVLVTPAALGAAASTGGTLRRVMLFCAVLSGLALFHADSMGAWVGLTGGAFVVLVLVMLAGTLSGAARRWLLLGFLIVLISAAATVLTSWMSPVQRPSFRAREVTHRIALAAIKEHPVLGVGARGFPRVSTRLERQLYGRDLVEVHSPDGPLSAHSSFLDVTVERGLLGLALFVGLLASILLPGIRACLRARDEEHAILLGLVAGLTAFTLQAFTENLFAFSKVAAVFWILAATLARLAERASA